MLKMSIDYYASLSHEELITRLEKTENSLSQAMNEVGQRKRELQLLIRGARAVLEDNSFAQTARAIFDYCRELTGAASGYVALLNEEGAENELLFLEAGGLPCSVDPELPMPIRGLREVSYREKRVVYDNDFMKSEWVNFMPKGHVVLNNVLFAPLILEDKAVGLIGLANKPEGFNENDTRIAGGFGELAAIALRNSKVVEERLKAEAAREKLIKDLREALDKIHTLRGLLPICSVCKKVRDDKGYWSQIESYVQSHSEAEFSHGICPDCAASMYPGIDLSDEEEEG
jgi:hypothetical protein